MFISGQEALTSHKTVNTPLMINGHSSQPNILNFSNQL